MNKQEIISIFKKFADISHDCDGHTIYDNYASKTIVKAMSEANFIEAISEIKLLNLQNVIKSLCPNCSEKVLEKGMKYCPNCSYKMTYFSEG